MPILQEINFALLVVRELLGLTVLAVVVTANFSVLKVAYAMAEQRCVTHPVLLEQHDVFITTLLCVSRLKEAVFTNSIHAVMWIFLCM